MVQVSKKGVSPVAQQQRLCQCRKRKFDPWVGKIPWRRAWQPTSSLENPMERGAQWATVHRVSKSWIRLSDLAHTQAPRSQFSIKGFLLPSPPPTFFFFKQKLRIFFFVPEHSIDLCSMGKPFTKTGLDYFTNIILLKEFSATNQNFLSHFLGEGTRQKRMSQVRVQGESASFCMKDNFEDQARVMIDGSLE